MGHIVCPVCDVASFTDVTSLKKCLGSVFSRALVCVVCNETVHGIASLHQHLCEHEQHEHRNASNSNLENNINCTLNVNVDSSYAPKFFLTHDRSTQNHNSTLGLKQPVDEVYLTGNASNENILPFHKLDIRDGTILCDSISTQSSIETKTSISDSPKCAGDSLDVIENYPVSTPDSKVSVDNHSCNECGLVFSSGHFLLLHKDIVHKHSDCFEVSCKLCKKKFSNLELYRNHVREFHNEQRYMCEECPKTFKLKGSLVVHRKMYHSGAPSICTFCHKKFPSDARRDFHQRRYHRNGGKTATKTKTGQDSDHSPATKKQHVKMENSIHKAKASLNSLMEKNRNETQNKQNNTNACSSASNSPLNTAAAHFSEMSVTYSDPNLTADPSTSSAQVHNEEMLDLSNNIDNTYDNSAESLMNRSFDAFNHQSKFDHFFSKYLSRSHQSLNKLNFQDQSNLRQYARSHKDLSNLPYFNNNDFMKPMLPRVGVNFQSSMTQNASQIPIPTSRTVQQSRATLPLETVTISPPNRNDGLGSSKSSDNSASYSRETVSCSSKSLQPKNSTSAAPEELALQSFAGDSPLNKSQEQQHASTSQAMKANIVTIKSDKTQDTTNRGKTGLPALLGCEGKPYECDVCKKCFTTKYFLKKHKRLHTGETPYSCNECGKTFTFQQSYHKHLLYHSDEKPHVCSYCGRAFKEMSTLHNHVRIHTGEKPFVCETCGKAFRQRVSYLVHLRIHTGVLPYSCQDCNKSFRYKVSLRSHKCDKTNLAITSSPKSKSDTSKDNSISEVINPSASNSLKVDGSMSTDHSIPLGAEMTFQSSNLVEIKENITKFPMPRMTNHQNDSLQPSNFGFSSISQSKLRVIPIAKDGHFPLAAETSVPSLHAMQLTHEPQSGFQSEYHQSFQNGLDTPKHGPFNNSPSQNIPIESNASLGETPGTSLTNFANISESHIMHNIPHHNVFVSQTNSKFSQTTCKDTEHPPPVVLTLSANDSDSDGEMNDDTFFRRLFS